MSALNANLYDPVLSAEGKRVAGDGLLPSLAPRPGGVAFGGVELLRESRADISRQILLARRESKRLAYNRCVAVRVRETVGEEQAQRVGTAPCLHGISQSI